MRYRGPHNSASPAGSALPFPTQGVLGGGAERRMERVTPAYTLSCPVLSGVDGNFARWEDHWIHLRFVLNFLLFTGTVENADSRVCPCFLSPCYYLIHTSFRTFAGLFTIHHKVPGG